MQVILKQHLRLLISLSITLAIVLTITLYPVEYITTAPGYNDEVGDFITINDAFSTEGTFHTTSVIVLDRTTLLQYLVGSWEDKVDIREYPEYYQTIDIDDLQVMGSIYKNDSLARSLIVGISKSGHEIDYETVDMVYLTYNYLQEGTLELGDIVTAVNGNTDIFAETASVQCNQTATFDVLRDEEELSFTIPKQELPSGTCLFGLQIKNFAEIFSSDVDYTLHETLTGGSSGGLMQSLYVFNQLTPNDITGGLKVAGTGTIDIDGSVGAIGGIEQKIITSSLNGIDIFFAPHLSDSEYDNYVVAMKTLETLHTDMIIVPVTTIDDALTYLESRFGGAFSE